MVHGDLGDYVQSLAYYREALGIKQEVYGTRHLSVADTLSDLGAIHRDLDDHMQSLSCYREVLAIRKEVYKAKHPLVASTLNDLGHIHSALGDHVQSLAYYTEALAMRKELYGNRPHLSVASTLYGLGNVYKATGAYMKSIQCYEECLDIEERLCGEIHADVAITLADLGNVHSLLGEHARSIGYYEEALQIRRQVHDGLHPCVAQILHSLGNAHKNSGDLTGASAYYGEAFRMYQLLGAIFQHFSKHAQAVECFEKALGVGKKIHGAIHPDVAAMLYRLAIVYYSSDQLPESTVYYEEALSVYQQLSGGYLENPYASARAGIAHRLACMYHVEALAAMQGEQEQAAQEYMTRANEAFELAIASSDPPTASLCLEYGRFLIVTERVASAYQYLQQAIAVGDGDAGRLSYRASEKEIVASVLREKLDPGDSISLRPVDYAYYLLIHHYEDFQAAGIHPGKAREAYLEDYRQVVDQQAGQEGREEEDEMARYLLEGLELTLGVVVR